MKRRTRAEIEEQRRKDEEFLSRMKLWRLRNIVHFLDDDHITRAIGELNEREKEIIGGQVALELRRLAGETAGNDAIRALAQRFEDKTLLYIALTSLVKGRRK